MAASRSYRHRFPGGGCTARVAGRAGDRPVSNAARSSAGGLGGGVVADLVQQAGGQLLGAGADGAAAAAGDQRHQRGEVPGAAGEQVVRQVVGDHAAAGAGEHEVLLDGQQQLPPGPPARLGADLERADAQGGPAAGVLGELFLAGGQALADQAAALQADADEQERDREGVGQVLEVVGHVPAVAARGPGSARRRPRRAGLQHSDALGGPVAEFLGVAPLAGQAEEPAQHRVERPLGGREVRHTCATGIRSSRAADRGRRG